MVLFKTSRVVPPTYRWHFIFSLFCICLIIPGLTVHLHRIFQSRHLPFLSPSDASTRRNNASIVPTVSDRTITAQSFDGATDKFKFEGMSVQRVKRNSSCILVGCASFGTPGMKYFWDFYSTFGYSVAVTTFTRLTHSDMKAHPAWCRLPAVHKELASNPNSKVIYMDVDTLANLNTWCNLPGLGEHAPMIMNSLHRAKPAGNEYFTVHGSQIQSNAFITAPGKFGQGAIDRWSHFYGSYGVLDQGSVHLHEKGLCGVPGWIHCYSNPYQQNCHCAGGFNHVKAEKAKCIQRLFNGSKLGCPLSVIMNE